MLLGVATKWLLEAILSISSHQAKTQWAVKHKHFSSYCFNTCSTPPSSTYTCTSFLSWSTKCQVNSHHIKYSKTETTSTPKCFHRKTTGDTHLIPNSTQQACSGATTPSDDKGTSVYRTSTPSRDSSACSCGQRVSTCTSTCSSAIWERWRLFFIDVLWYKEVYPQRKLSNLNIFERYVQQELPITPSSKFPMFLNLLMHNAFEIANPSSRHVVCYE